jgi:membrane associated rhomboid family serine protease
MGFQDRDYSRDDEQGNFFAGATQQRMMVTNIAIICVAIFLIDAFTPFPPNQPGGLRQVSGFLALKADVWQTPWNVWQLLTYGFAHASLGSRIGFWHVAGNMFTLWMLGRMVELKYGRREFLTFYLVSIVVCGIAWIVIRNVFHQSAATCVGASGAVSAVVGLFIFNFPKQELYLYGIIRIRAWILGLVIIGIDMISAFSMRDSVAHDAHLAGFAFSFVYWRLGWRLSDWLPGSDALTAWKAKRKSSLKIHDPDSARDEAADRVLEKIHQQGESSLTRKERKILEEYSRRVKERRKQ